MRHQSCVVVCKLKTCFLSFREDFLHKQARLIFAKEINRSSKNGPAKEQRTALLIILNIYWFLFLQTIGTKEIEFCPSVFVVNTFLMINIILFFEVLRSKIYLGRGFMKAIPKECFRHRNFKQYYS